LNKNLLKSIGIWIAIGIIMMTIFNQFSSSSRLENKLVYSQFMDQVKSGNIEKVRIDGQNITGTTNNGKKFSTFAPTDPWLVSDLLKNGVVVEAQPAEKQSFLASIFISWFPMILLIGVWIFFMKQMQGGGKGGGPFSFGKSKARQLDQTSNKTTFKDVAGCDEAKEEVTEMVDFLKDPAKFHKLGGRIPRGVLLVGPPGTGKTLLARAVAGEAKVPFFTISGSDFVEMFVGVGAARVRDMFEQAKKSSPCIIFIDEIDAVGRSRGAGTGGGNDEREQTLNQLLVELDGFEPSSGVIVVAATNRADVLDKALLRPGRFDRQIMVGLPDIKGREEILHVHMRKIPTDNDVRADILARGTPGFSGADLANLVNEAALFAARGNKAIVDMEDFEQAKDKIYMGPERKSLVLPNADPVHKVTIMPRGYALGLTWQLPEFDRFSNFKTKMLEEISILFGGRIAEEVFMKQMSTGAGNDFERATKLARDMVTKYGMSDKLGTMVYADENQESFFGAPKAISQATQQLVDAEIKSILDKQYLIARKLIEKNKKKIEAMTKALLEYETIDSDQIDDVMAGKKVRAPKPSKSSNDKKMPPSGKAPTSSIKPQPATKSR
jgi:cell division protease FtsH